MLRRAGVVPVKRYAHAMPTRPSRKHDAPLPQQHAESVGLLGVGLDGEDGHSRVTRGEDFYLVGGSHETHERMQGLIIRMNEKLKRRGKRFQDLSPTMRILDANSLGERISLVHLNRY